MPRKPSGKTSDAERARKRTWYSKNRVKRVAKQRDWYDRNKDKIVAASYNLTPAQYEEMAREQGYVCAISGRPAGKHRLVVDHDHASNTNRGLLDHSINMALGLFKENPEWLERAAQYLRARTPGLHK